MFIEKLTNTKSIAKKINLLILTFFVYVYYLNKYEHENKIQTYYFNIFLLLFNFGYSQVGINTTTPLSTLDVNGTLSVKHITLIGTPAVTLINDGVYVSVDPRATDQEFKLPSPIAFPGRIYILRNINDTFTAKLTTVAGQFFFRGLTTGGTPNIYMYDNNNRSFIAVSDGLNWTIF